MSIFGKSSSEEQATVGSTSEGEVGVTGSVGGVMGQTEAPVVDETATIDEEKLDIIGHTEDGTPIATRESMVEQFGEEAIRDAEDNAEVLDEAPVMVAEGEEVVVAGKKVVSHDGRVDAMGRFIEEDHYEDGTGQTVAIDGVKVN